MPHPYTVIDLHKMKRKEHGYSADRAISLSVSEACLLAFLYCSGTSAKITQRRLGSRTAEGKSWQRVWTCLAETALEDKMLCDHPLIQVLTIARRNTKGLRETE